MGRRRNEVASIGIMACSVSWQRLVAAAGLTMGLVEMYQGVERRMNPRHQSPKTGVILLEQDSLIKCEVKDFSPAGVGLLLFDAVDLPAEFDLTFDSATRRCVTVWRRTDRMGVKFRST
jgi:hypothetical protein